MEIFSKEFIETFGIKGVSPAFSIAEEFDKLGEGIIFQECNGYGFIGLAYDGITRSAVYMANSLRDPYFLLVPCSKLNEYFIKRSVKPIHHEV